MLAYNTLRVA